MSFFQTGFIPPLLYAQRIAVFAADRGLFVRIVSIMNQFVYRNAIHTLHIPHARSITSYASREARISAGRPLEGGLHYTDVI